MAIRKKATTTKRQTTESKIDEQVNKVLGKLFEQEPRLRGTLSRTIAHDNGPTDIADQTVQTYRQKLREK